MRDKGRAIRKVMGGGRGGVGNFQLARIFFFAHGLCRNFFSGEPLCTNFFLDKYCFFLTLKS